jgi:hypothetical protein
MSRSFLAAGVALAGVSFLSVAVDAAPIYKITALGPVTNGTASSGDAVSPSGNFVAGFSNLTTAGGGGSRALLYSASSGSVAVQPNLTTVTRNFSTGRGVNDFGVVVGTGAGTAFGANPLPVIWKNGVASQLPLPSGETVGRANAVNNAEVAVGSVNGGVNEIAARYTTAGSRTLTETTTAGGRLTTAFGINAAGRIVGQALDPNNAAITSAFYLDDGAAEAQVIPPLSGRNAGIAFAVSSDGRVAGVSSFNGGDGRAFVWSSTAGSVEVPLPAGASTAIARGVNSSGWVVGVGSGAFALPFLYDGTQTHLLSSLIEDATGWNFDTNTSSIAYAIADDGSIAGRAVLNGQVTGFVLTIVPEPGTLSLLIPAIGLLARRRRA